MVFHRELRPFERGFPGFYAVGRRHLPIRIALSDKQAAAIFQRGLGRVDRRFVLLIICAHAKDRLGDRCV